MRNDANKHLPNVLTTDSVLEYLKAGWALFRFDRQYFLGRDVTAVGNYLLCHAAAIKGLRRRKFIRLAAKDPKDPSWLVRFEMAKRMLKAAKTDEEAPEGVEATQETG